MINGTGLGETHYSRGIVCFLLLGFALGGTLQAQLTTGTILGTVKDQTDALVAGAAVTATNQDTGIVRTTITGSRGEYRLPALSVGT